MEKLKSFILDVPDFPKEGITFKDITPIFENFNIFNSLIEKLKVKIPTQTTQLVAIESRGFLLASALSIASQLPFCIVRKPGKLPRKTISQTYSLEYGSDKLHIHESSIQSHDHVLIIDDVLATGGTAHATENLCKKCGAQSISSLFFIELKYLNGEKNLEFPFQSLVHF